MLTSKTRRVGDSIEITLPVDENVEILPDTAQLIQYHDNGAIVLIPKTDEN